MSIRIAKVEAPEGNGMILRVDDIGDFVLVDKRGLPERSLTEAKYEDMKKHLLITIAGYIPLDEI